MLTDTDKELSELIREIPKVVNPLNRIVGQLQKMNRRCDDLVISPRQAEGYMPPSKEDPDIPLTTEQRNTIINNLYKKFESLKIDLQKILDE